MRSTKIITICSSSLCTCLHHMVILRTRNKITDFLMILAWASPFKKVIGKACIPRFGRCSLVFLLFHGRAVLYSEGPMFRRSYVLQVLYSEGPMFRRSYVQKIFVQKVLCLEGSMFRRSYIQICSEGLIFRKFFVLWRKKLKSFGFR